MFIVAEQLQNFLRKWFDHSFTNHSTEWLPFAVDTFLSTESHFLTDVSATFPGEPPRVEFDRDVFDVIETDSTVEAILYYRIARSLYLREPRHPSLRYFASLMRSRTAIEIYYSASIGPRFSIGHGAGLVIGPQHVIGSNFIAYQGVTLGQRRITTPREFITIGDHCTVCAGAKILGTVRVGNNVRVAANAVLLSDAESDSTYAGVPAVKVKSSSVRFL